MLVAGFITSAKNSVDKLFALSLFEKLTQCDEKEKNCAMSVNRTTMMTNH